MAERSRLTEAREHVRQDLFAKLRGKDAELKELQDTANQGTAELNRQLQNSQSELNKKDYELQVRDPPEYVAQHP